MTRLTILAITFALSAPAFSQTISGLVVYVADGDTLTVLDVDRRQHKIRLDEIDAPEIGHGRNRPGQPYGQNSSKALADMCMQRQATVEVMDTDRYGRTVGRVNCDGKDVNLAQVRTGMAWNYRQYNRRPEIARAEQEARAARMGLWADSNPVPPWAFRQTPTTARIPRFSRGEANPNQH